MVIISQFQSVVNWSKEKSRFCFLGVKARFVFGNWCYRFKFLVNDREKKFSRRSQWPKELKKFCIVLHTSSKILVTIAKMTRSFLNYRKNIKSNQAALNSWIKAVAALQVAKKSDKLEESLLDKEEEKEEPEDTEGGGLWNSFTR